MANQNLKIQITAIDRTKAAFRGIAVSLGKVQKALFSFKTAIVGVVGAAGLGLLVKSSLDSIDALGKTASKLGVTSQELQKLRFAAELAGVSTRTTDMAIQRFTRRLSEAAVDTGEAKNALIELGLNARELAKLPLEKQMLELSAAFDKVEDSGDRVRLAFKLFDSEGVAFINTLEGGRDALQATLAEVDDLGIALSSVTVRGVERANDAFLRLGSLARGVRDSVVGALAPAFEELADAIRFNVLEAIKEAGGVEQFGRDLALTIVRIFRDAAKAIQSFVDLTIRKLNEVLDFTREIGEAIGNDFIASIERIDTVDLGLIGVFENIEIKIQEATFAAERAKDALGDVGQAGGEAAKKVTEGFDFVRMKLDDVKKNGINALEDALVDVGSQTRSLKEAFSDMARSILRDIMRMQIRQAITLPLAQALGLSVQPRAMGGPVTAGRPYMVGERGPELFVPGRSGSIVPHGGMGGGVTVNQTINLTTGVSQTVRAEVLNMLPQIADAAKGAVIDAKRRGGSYAAALG
tara:strand:- start:5434 stop:7002 length:1569 start_codon:yes stop_codon:yes gene_type:complete